MNITVIGGGIAGLVAAWQLSRRHTVTRLESHAVPRFIASSAAVDATASGLRVFYPGCYPTLTRLCAGLGVATEPVDYATTFTGSDGRATFVGAMLAWAIGRCPMCCARTWPARAGWESCRARCASRPGPAPHWPPPAWLARACAARATAPTR